MDIESHYDNQFVKESGLIIKKSRSTGQTIYEIKNKVNPLKYGGVNPKNYQYRDPGVPLNRIECAAVRDMFYGTASIQISAESFRSILFKTPFSVYFGSRERGSYFPLKENVQQNIIVRYWMPFLFELYNRLKLEGVVPYYYKKVRLGGGSRKGKSLSIGQKQAFHLVPVIPPLGSGETYTYMNGKEQDYYWKWSNLITDNTAAGLEDGGIYFVVRNPPLLDGTLTSPLKALLSDRIYLDLIELTAFQLAQNLINPLHVVTFNPDLKSATAIVQAQDRRHPDERNPAISGTAGLNPVRQQTQQQTALEYVTHFRRRGIVGENGRTPLSDLGISDDINGRLMGRASMEDAVRGYKSSKSSSTATSRFNALNSLKRVQQGIDNINGTDNLEDGATIEERLAWSRMVNTMLLEPGEHYQAGAKPSSFDLNHTFFVQRFDELTSAALGFPLFSMIKQTGTKSGGSAISIFESELQAETAIFSAITKEILCIAYMPDILKSIDGLSEEISNGEGITYGDLISPDMENLSERREKLLAIADSSDLEVVFQRPPMKSFEDFEKLFARRIIDAKTFYKLSMDSMGLSSFGAQPPKEYFDAIEKLYPIPSGDGDGGFGIGARLNQETQQPNSKKADKQEGKKEDSKRDSNQKKRKREDESDEEYQTEKKKKKTSNQTEPPKKKSVKASGRKRLRHKGTVKDDERPSKKQRLELMYSLMEQVNNLHDELELEEQAYDRVTPSFEDKEESENYESENE